MVRWFNWSASDPSALAIAGAGAGTGTGAVVGAGAGTGAGVYRYAQLLSSMQTHALRLAQQVIYPLSQLSSLRINLAWHFTV